MSDRREQELDTLANIVDRDDPGNTLRALADRYPGRVVFSTSFGIEDQVITHIIGTGNIPVRIFTLDTGRLFAETHALWARTLERYGVRIDSFFPDADALARFVGEHGPNPFYESVDLRRECCALRKVEPLRRALAGSSVWVTGVRAEHSAAREERDILEWDGENDVMKYHPLLSWTGERVREFARRNGVPVSPLHERGFASIGCAPCTRAILPGEESRAGRWWWEHQGDRECGLHRHDAASRGTTFHEQSGSDR